MRTGEIPPNTAWRGNPLGGVKAPQPILLPAPRELFARRASRFEALADGHPMAPWLHFMGALARAQAVSLVEAPVVDAAGIARAVAAGLPPLAAQGHRRADVWREGLRALLSAFDHAHSPPAARAAADALTRRPESEIEAMADDTLTRRSADAGDGVYVAAALQGYFAVMAASLPTEELRLLPERGLCPCCGSTPVGGVIVASGDSPGVRYLHCGLCGAAFLYTRALCTHCGGSRSLSLRSITGDAGVAKAETCGECRSYSKLFYTVKDSGIEPVADDLATLGLDLLVAEEGFGRPAPIPWFGP